jgi:hypothetical protein
VKRWEDLGNGQHKLTLTDAEGNLLSTFRGTKDEINEKLADSAIQAGQRIRELRQGPNGARTPAAAAAPQPLSPAERMQTVAELNNPATVDKAVTRVIESVVGPVSELRKNNEAENQDREVRAAVDAAATFARATPEWYPSDYNKNKLVRYLQTQGLDHTNPAHYTQAFEELSAAELLQPRPTEAPPSTDETVPEGRNAPTPTQPTPTRFSTSVRQSDISGTAPRPVIRLKFTREQIANMSAATYKRLMQNDPELARCVDYYANQDARKRRAS